MHIKDLIREAHDTAKEKGWYGPNGDEQRNIPEALALIHSEVSEALEDYRKGHMGPGLIYVSDTGYIKESILLPEATGAYKPVGFDIELADVLIRTFDMCGALKIDLEAAIARKMQYNKTRPYRHGNKAC